MLIDYKFDNFCSFGASCEFSMIAPVGKVKKRYPDNYVPSSTGVDALKTAVIVGENAGGKSNFINSLMFLKNAFVTNKIVKSLNAFINSARMTKEKGSEQCFELSFISASEIVYTYKLKIDSLGIMCESLQKSTGKRSAGKAVYEIVRGADGAYVAKGSKNKDLISNVLKNSNNSVGLFVNKLALLGDTDAQKVSDWFVNVLCPEAITMDVLTDLKRQDADIQVLKDERYLEIFRMVDYSICGLDINEEKPYTKSIIYRKDCNGSVISRELQMDSTGVREFFVWAIEIFRVVYEDKVVFADEMDRVLNPVLSDRIVAFITGCEHRGQFVFSSHNVLHLDLKNYMKEQIYFVTKNRDSLSSEMYSLADFPEVRYDNAKIYEFYMKGILGGTSVE